MDGVLVFLVVFAAIFTQSVTGFGLALVSMPLLTALLGAQTAAPLVAFIGLVTELCLLLYYRHDFKLAVVWRLALASLVGIPLGILALDRVAEEVVLTVLGLIVAGYALYALLKLRLPAIRQPAWAYGAGFIAGILGGAYNTSGPPVIVYGNCRGWSPGEFKSNLQGFFLLNSAVVLGAHALADNYTAAVVQNSLIGLPAMGAGLVMGLLLAKRISAQRFRQVVLWLLLALGVWLMVG